MQSTPQSDMLKSQTTTTNSGGAGGADSQFKKKTEKRWLSTPLTHVFLQEEEEEDQLQEEDEQTRREQNVVNRSSSSSSSNRTSTYTTDNQRGRGGGEVTRELPQQQQPWLSHFRPEEEQEVQDQSLSQLYLGGYTTHNHLSEGDGRGLRGREEEMAVAPANWANYGSLDMHRENQGEGVDQLYGLSEQQQGPEKKVRSYKRRPRAISAKQQEELQFQQQQGLQQDQKYQEPHSWIAEDGNNDEAVNMNTGGSEKPPAPVNSGELEYYEGEKILAYHMSLIYEAKVLKVRLSDEPVTNTENGSAPPVVSKRNYFIHYAGWNEKWDEWVDTSRIMKFNEENKKIQDGLRAEYKRAYNTTKRLRGNPIDPKSKKRKVYQEKVIDPKFKVEIPHILKKKIIEDWEQVTCQKFLVVLPRIPTVAQILDDFTQYLSHNVDSTFSDQIEAIGELKMYFDKALGSLLLYRFERRQYGEILKQHFEKNLCEVYGVEHLLRFCVKVPHMLSAAEPTDRMLSLMKSTITELLKYIANNLQKFSSLAAIYEPAPQQYLKDVTS